MKQTGATTLIGALLISTMLPAAVARAKSTELRASAITPSTLRDQGFVPLFAGPMPTLDAWDTNEIKERHWRIVGEELHYDGQNEGMKWTDSNLWTKADYDDICLYAEWRLPSEPVMKPHPIVLWNGDFLLDDEGKRITRPRLDAGDSGILFRGILRCQANIWSQELGSGEVNGYRTDRKLPTRLRQSCLPFAFGDKPLGAWNGFTITLKNDQMTVYLNGTLVLATEPLPDLPARGPIGLQHHGDPVQFRNIWVKELEHNE